MSESIVSVGYDPERATLEIEFEGGGVYDYYAVPRRVHDALMSADSHGRYFAAEIRDRYRYARQ